MLCTAAERGPSVNPGASQERVPDPSGGRLSHAAALARRLVVAGLALAAPLAAADLQLEGHALADGRLAVLLDSRLYLPDAQGRLGRAADGRYARRDGGEIVVAGGRATPPRGGRLDRPAPRVALATSLASGEAVALVDGELLFVERDGSRRPVPDGTYHFRNGSVGRVRGGRITSLGDLSGFLQIEGAGPRSGASAARRAPRPPRRLFPARCAR